MNLGLFLILAAVVLVVAGAMQFQARRRERELAAWAARRGLSYRRGPEDEIARRFAEFVALGGDVRRRPLNICTGKIDGREVCLFDLASADAGRSERDITAVLVRSDFPLLPLRIRHEHALDRLREALGDNDIDFESTAFSDRFHVTAGERKWAYDVIHPRQMEYLLEHGRWSIELAGWHCLVWQQGRLPVGDLDAAIALARGVLDRIPDRVRRELLGPRS